MTHTAFHNNEYTLHINAVVQHSYTFFPDGNLTELTVMVTACQSEHQAQECTSTSTECTSPGPHGS